MENNGRRGLKIYAVVMTVCFVIAVAAVSAMSVYLFMKDTEEDSVEANAPGESGNYFTAAQLAELLEAEHDAAYEKAYEQGVQELLDIIKQRMSTGTVTLQLLRELYPEYLVYSEKGGYVFGDILDIPKSSFQSGDFWMDDEEGVLRYIGGQDIKTYKAIDVSKFQGDIDWEKVAADGVDYVFIRAGLRGYGTGAVVEDERFEENIKGAKAAGLKVGVYFFSEAVSEEEAVEEAEFVLEKIGDYEIELPIVIDIEEIPDDTARNEELSKEELTEVVGAFMERVKESGYTPMLYGNIKCLVSMVDIEKLSEYDMWYAYYNDDIYIPYQVAGWQYASDGRVDGIAGNCDLNIFFKEWD